MDTINIVVNRFIRYMSKLGLEEWQLQIIFIIFVILLILIAIRKLKRRAILIRKVQDGDGRGIIGKRLYNHGEHHTEVKDIKEHHQVSAPAEPTKEGEPDYGQSTNLWEKAREQISRLKDEITKRKQTEGHLRQIIDDLKKSNLQISNETTEGQNIENCIGPEPFMSKDIDLQIPEVNRNEQAGNGLKESGELIHINNQDRTGTAEDKKDKVSSKQPGSPLDDNELRAIAELAKRLGGNNRQPQ